MPHALLVDVADTMDRYGRLQLVKHPTHGLVLVSLDRAVLEEVLRQKKIAPMLGERIDDDTVLVHPSERGRLKQALLKVGWPAEDLAGYVDGEAHPIELRPGRLAAARLPAAGRRHRSGPAARAWSCCRAARARRWSARRRWPQAKATTLILVTNTVAGRQWKRELLARTSLTEEEIGEYSGENARRSGPVTIATYQVMTTRRKGEYRHLELFDSRDWGLIIYDEVHLLPAPIFRLTADLQSRRRLGLTATLIREDGREGDVFSPDRPEALRRAVEGHREPGLDRAGRLHRGAGDAHRRRADGVRHGRARGPLQDRRHRPHEAAGHRARSSTGTPTTRSLVIGAYLDQLDDVADHLGGVPIIQGSTTNQGARTALRRVPRAASTRVLVVSKVANFSIDLPEAAVAVQISGTFGSRQEEAQRLGRVLRPKADGRQAHFYTVVARDTLDAEYAAHRQRFLAEQGYAYTIVDADDLLRPI